jgi:hypothetical protein
MILKKKIINRIAVSANVLCNSMFSDLALEPETRKRRASPVKSGRRWTFYGQIYIVYRYKKY